ncbi:MAG TPA: hypothetical protein VGP46_09690, partial [Acidimicrobiales bacterium]|nr:hypothetical protein [Acidimicrobiales bacterium]
MPPEQAGAQFGKITGALSLLPGIRGTVTPRQAAARLARRARYKLVYPHARPGWLGYGRLPPVSSGSPPLAWPQSPAAVDEPGLLSAADLLGQGRIAFLNLPPARLGGGGWSEAPEDDPLWLYNLHYGEWALTLARAYAVSGDARPRDTLTTLMSSWLDSCPAGAQPAWDPYPLARRLVAWSKVAMLLQSDRDWGRFWTERLQPSLRAQASMLE